MNKNIFAFFIFSLLCISPKITLSQLSNSLVIALQKKYSDPIEFILTEKYDSTNNNYTSQSRYTGIPSNINKYIIKTFDLQPEQGWYELYKRLNGDMPTKDLKYILNNYKLTLNDTTNLSKTPIKHFVSFLIGISGDKKIIIGDLNNDYDFSNDKVFMYDTLNNAQSKNNRRNLSTATFKYQYVFKGVVWDKDISLIINPFPKNFKYNDSLENELYLTIGSNEIRSGNLRNETKNITFKIAPTPFSVRYDAGAKITTSGYGAKTNFYYSIGDTLTVNKLLYKVNAISAFGDSLYLTYAGKADKTFGIYPNEYAYYISSTDVITGQLFESKKYLGKYILLDFWGSWCAPCIESIPTLSEINEKHHTILEVVSIAFDSLTKVNTVKGIISKYGMHWINLFDEMSTLNKNSITTKFKVSTFPTQLLIDPKGKIIFRSYGLKKLDNTALESILK